MKPTDSQARAALARTQAPVADTTDLTAIPSTRVGNLQLIAVGSPKSVYIYDKDDTAVVDPGSVEVPDDIAASAAYISDPTTAPGRWTNIAALAAGASGAGAGAATFRAMAATTANLSASLRGNTLEADANGALGTIDGVTLAVGKVLFVKDQSSPEANGLFEIDAMGGASAIYSMTRIAGFDSDADALAGTSVFVSQGTANGNKIFDLTTDDPITLNSTGLVWTERPTLAGLASTASGKGMSLVGVFDTAGRFVGSDGETVLADLGARISLAVADATALQGVTEAARANGQIVVKLDDDTIWTFDSASSASASAWVIVPTAGTGRWLRKQASIADLTTLKVPAMQAVDATLASGTITINSGIVVASTSEVIPLLIGHLTGTTNFGSLAELKASRVNGADGVGTVVIEAIGADGDKDADAAGAIRVVIMTPV